MNNLKCFWKFAVKIISIRVGPCQCENSPATLFTPLIQYKISKKNVCLAKNIF